MVGLDAGAPHVAPGADAVEEQRGRRRQRAAAVRVAVGGQLPRAGFAQVLGFDEGDAQAGGCWVRSCEHDVSLGESIGLWRGAVGTYEAR